MILYTNISEEEFKKEFDSVYNKLEISEISNVYFKRFNINFIL